MARKDALRLRATATFASAALQTLYTDFVEPGMIGCLEQIAWQFDTALSGGNDRARLYIDGHGYKHQLAQASSPTEGKIYTYTKKPYLYPGERLALELDQGDSDNIAEMNITGYWEAIKE